MLVFEEARVQSSVEVEHYARFVLPLSARVVRAIPADEAAQSTMASVRPTAIVPALRDLSGRDREIRRLYERAAHSIRELGGSEAVAALEQIHTELGNYPDEWLLRWTLLERLLQLGGSQRVTQLVAELELLEVEYSKLQPIATGLRSLLSLASGAQNDIDESMEAS
jgi:hypothetical protein